MPRHAAGDRCSGCTRFRSARRAPRRRSIDAALRAFPRRTVLVTHMTATGRAAGARSFGDRVVQAWLPYDVPFAVRAFLAHFRPRAGLLHGDRALAEPRRARARARRAALPRQRAAVGALGGGYARIAALTRPMLAALAGVAAQTDADAARLRGAGRARRRSSPATSSSTSASPDAALRWTRAARALRRRARPCWLAASTREGEEALHRSMRSPRRPLPPGDADGHRAAPSAALRRRRRAAARARHPVRPPQRQRGGARGRRRRARRFDGRDARATTRPPTWRSSAAACCRSAART